MCEDKFIKKVLIVFVLHFFMSIFTFGYAQNHNKCNSQYCLTKDIENFAGSILWPYYWSEEIQSKYQ